MRYLRCDIVDSCAYLIPIGDIHLGDRAFGKEGQHKLRGYLEWVKARPNARIFLMGDIFNVASRISKTNPFESDSSEYERAKDWFEPVAGQIVGAIDGNHEARVVEMFGYSPLQSLCAQLKIPYCKWSAVLELNVGKQCKARKLAGIHRQYNMNRYYIYFHHCTGGGTTLGGALNRKVKLQEIVQGMDVYCGAHDHQLVSGMRTVFMPEPRAGVMYPHRVTYVDTGSYLEWNESYAEKGMLPCGKLGSPRLRFAGAANTGKTNTFMDRQRSKDVHLSQ